MRAHVSLAVRNVPRAVEFYSQVFGAAPQKQTRRYAKFDIAEPALNFSLVEGREPSRVSHLGIEVDDGGQFEQLRTRLAGAGIETVDEKDSRCCYARQDKLWFRDPDGNAWEVFQVYEQLPVTEPAPDESMCGASTSGKASPNSRTACCGS